MENKIHKLEIITLKSDGFAVVKLDGEPIKSWYSYCEHCDELAFALEYVFDKIGSEPIEYIHTEVDEFEGDDVEDEEEEDYEL